MKFPLNFRLHLLILIFHNRAIIRRKPKHFTECPKSDGDYHLVVHVWIKNEKEGYLIPLLNKLFLCLHNIYYRQLYNDVFKSSHNLSKLKIVRQKLKKPYFDVSCF